MKTKKAKKAKKITSTAPLLLPTRPTEKVKAAEDGVFDKLTNYYNNGLSPDTRDMLEGGLVGAGVGGVGKGLYSLLQGKGLKGSLRDSLTGALLGGAAGVGYKGLSHAWGDALSSAAPKKPGIEDKQNDPSASGNGQGLTPGQVAEKQKELDNYDPKVDFNVVTDTGSEVVKDVTKGGWPGILTAGGGATAGLLLPEALDYRNRVSDSGIKMRQKVRDLKTNKAPKIDIGAAEFGSKPQILAETTDLAKRFGVSMKDIVSDPRRIKGRGKNVVDDLLLKERRAKSYKKEYTSSKKFLEAEAKELRDTINDKLSNAAAKSKAQQRLAVIDKELSGLDTKIRRAKGVEDAARAARKEIYKRVPEARMGNRPADLKAKGEVRGPSKLLRAILSAIGLGAGSATYSGVAGGGNSGDGTSE